MILEKLSILNYKSIRQAELELSAKMNCFIGHNGAGKTNLLDAVYYLSFCRSAFTNIDAQVVTHDADFFVLEGSYRTDHGDTEQVYCGMKRGTKKHFKRNKKEYKRLSQHIGLVPLIFLSPADTLLIEGGSEERRHFMDVAISQVDPQYIEALNRYNKALQQRNSLLKQEEEPDPDLLAIWEEQMAAEGEQIFQRRDAFIRTIEPAFQRIYQHIANGREEVALGYLSHCQRGPLLDVIRRDRAKDRIMGYSLHGIHRDDIEMTQGGFPMKREGSQGQNKSFVVALKLAQFAYLRQTGHASAPILLLDDIFDKLDADRVSQIVHLVASPEYGQIFITDTNREHLDQILSHCDFDYRIFHVDGGKIEI